MIDFCNGLVTNAKEASLMKNESYCYLQWQFIDTKMSTTALHDEFVTIQFIDEEVKAQMH